MAGNASSLDLLPFGSQKRENKPQFLSSTITVKVCKSWSDRPDLRQTFTVQKCVLYKEDQFEERCLISQDEIVYLEADPEDFKTYLEWLYTRRLPEHIGKPRRDNSSNLNWLPSSYGLACKVGDPRYQNLLIVRMSWYAREIDDFPKTRFVRSLYLETESLSTNVPGRNLMVDLWAWKARPDWESIDNLTKVVCPEFVGQLCAALIDHRNTPSEKLVAPWANSKVDQYLWGVRRDER